MEASISLTAVIKRRLLHRTGRKYWLNYTLSECLQLCIVCWGVILEEGNFGREILDCGNSGRR